MAMAKIDCSGEKCHKCFGAGIYGKCRCSCPSSNHCSKCNGTGELTAPNGRKYNCGYCTGPCPDCGGNNHDKDCTECKGSGDKQCKRCGGTGCEPDSSRLT